MQHLFPNAAFFGPFLTFKLFPVLGALCQAGQWWGTEQREICPGAGGCVRAFVEELIFNTVRFAGGHWDLWGALGEVGLWLWAQANWGFVLSNLQFRILWDLTVKHFGKSPFGGCSTRLIQMHLQEMQFQGHSCRFPLLWSRAVLHQRQQQQLSAPFSLPFSPNEAASSISTPSPSGWAMPSR